MFPTLNLKLIKMRKLNQFIAAALTRENVCLLFTSSSVTVVWPLYLPRATGDLPDLAGTPKRWDFSFERAPAVLGNI